MRKFLPLFLVLFVGMALAAPDIQISVLNVSESVRPGGSFTVKMQLVNNGDATAEEVEMYPEVRTPFRTKAGTSDRETVSQLILGERASGTFHLNVLPRTSSGVYDIKLVAAFKYNDRLFKVTKSVAINVEAKPVLEVVSANYPTTYPGDFLGMKLEIKNIGGGLAKNVRIIYENTSSQIRPSSIAVAYLDELISGDSKEININLMVDGDADAMTYPVEIKILYEDEGGNLQPTVTRTLGIVVESKIELKTFLDSGTATQGVPSTLTISIANTGPNTAKYLEAIPVQNSFEVTPHAIYVGDLESDDFDTLDFKLTAPNAGDQKLSIELVYKDANNVESKELRKVAFKVLTPKEAAAQQPKSRTPYILLAIIIIGGAWYWRRRKKKHGRAS